MAAPPEEAYHVSARNVIKAIILGPLAIIVVLFAVANRSAVPVVIDPITQGSGAISLPVPLYALVLGALMLGVLIGGMFTWFSQGKYRKAARAHRKAAQQAGAEADRLRVELAAISQTSSQEASKTLAETSKALALNGMRS
jgi:uncharacterized integral membrane protein